MNDRLSSFTDILNDEIPDSQPLSLPWSSELQHRRNVFETDISTRIRPEKGKGQHGIFRCKEEIDSKYRDVFSCQYFNMVQSSLIEDALYSDKSMVVCAPTGSGKTMIFEMAIVQLLMDLESKNISEDFKIIYMAPVKALCTERLTEWYPKFNNLGLLCIEVTGDTDVDFTQLQAYKIIITTPEKWDMLTRRWRDHRGLVEIIKLFLIDEVHILNDELRGPVLEAVVSRMKTVESSAQSAHRIEKLQKQYQCNSDARILSTSENTSPPRIRFVAVSATVNNPEDVAAWLGTPDEPAVFYKFGDECRPVKLRRVVEGYPCADSTSIFKFDIILNYKIWPIIQKYYNGKPTLIFCNTRKSVLLTAETLSREITITFSPEHRARLTALASTIKNKKLQSLVLAGVGCHHAGMLFEERLNVEHAFRNRDLPILVTTTTLAMGVNLPAHLVIIKNTQQYVNGAYQEYSISMVLQMVGRAGRPQFDTEATAVIMTRLKDKARYQALVGGDEPLQSYLHKRLAENLNSEAALGTVGDVAQCVQWLRSTFLYVRAAKDPKRYLGLPLTAVPQQISKKIEEMCVRAMNGLASAGLISMDEVSCIQSTEAGRLMSIYYLDLETMKLIMKIQGDETLQRLLTIICESHELSDMHLRVDERRILNALNRNNAAATIRFPMKGKINTRQMKLSCIIQAVLGCLPIPDPSLTQEAMKVMRVAERICKCLVAYVTRAEVICQQRQCFSAVLNSIILTKCVVAHLWENSPFVSKQLKGIGPTFSTLLASAGKVNFMCLEESHPRDLERIMNKGPPAGNVLRKQVSLLPKYQLDSTPINEGTVLIRLQLLNHAYLSENMDNFTARESHKCYIIVGDSENHVLLLTSFKDKDLIHVYDGTMTYEITRKHNFEHKVFVHCISSTFVGIDVQCEYTFMNLMSMNPIIINAPTYAIEESTRTNCAYKSKNKKRKMSDEVTQSKEKKKRESALAEKFRILRESFSKASNQMKKDLQESTKTSENTFNQLVPNDESIEYYLNNKDIHEKVCNNNLEGNVFAAEDDEELKDFIDSERIDDILNEIESEMSSKNKLFHTNVRNPVQQNNRKGKETKNIYSKKERNEKAIPKYKFLELLERNNISTDDDEETSANENGFSNAIKTSVEKYLRASYATSTTSDSILKELCQNSVDVVQSDTAKVHDLNSLQTHVDDVIYIKETDIKTYKSNKNSQLTTLENTVNENQTETCSIKEIPVGLVSHISDKGNSFDQNQPIQQDNIYNVNFLGTVRNRYVYETPNDAEYKTGNANKTETCNIREIPIGLVSPTLDKDANQQICHYGNNIQQLQTLNTNRDLNFNQPFNQQSDYFTNYGICHDIGNKTIDNTASNILLASKTKHEDQSNDELFTAPSEQQVETNTEQSKLYPVSDQTENIIQNNLTHIIETKPLRTDVIRTIAITDQTCESFEGSNLFYIGEEEERFLGKSMKQKKKQQENKYKFTAEKFDVRTKLSVGHEICITRRLKFDLDVTEIISEKNYIQPANKQSKYFENEAYCERYNQQERSNISKINNFLINNVDSSILKDNIYNVNTPNTVTKNNINKIPDALENDSQVHKNEIIEDKNSIYSENNFIISKGNCFQNEVYCEPYYNGHSYMMNRNNIFSNEQNEPSLQDNIYSVNTLSTISNNNILKTLNAVENDANVPRIFSSIEEKNCINSANNFNTDKSLFLQNGVQRELFNHQGHSNVMKSNIISSNNQSQHMLHDKMYNVNIINSVEKNNIYKSPNAVENNADVHKTETFEEKKSSCDNIQSILQKYSTLIRNNNKGDIKPNIPSTQNIYKNIKTTQKKFYLTKPYKITELDNVDVSLNIIRDPPKSTSPPNSCNVNNVDFIIEEESSDADAHKSDAIRNHKNNKELICYAKTHDEASIHEDDLYDYNFSQNTINNEISQTNFNIDQSMLDPKRLLKCINNEDDEDLEIIPPPPEFSDDKLVYSPVNNDRFNENLLYQDTVFEAMEGPRNENAQEFLKDITDIHLPPSYEVETWTLSCDDDIKNFINSSVDLPRHTFVGNNFHNMNECVTHNSPVKRGKLSKFKFTHKNKFKLL